uniref:Ion transport domain-containing protein n=1 Tax=Palpitomonas bilix TaxID=652834 RepID=A0A7S3GFT3_9EUKA
MFPRAYFASGWNVLDFLVVVGSAVGVLLQILSETAVISVDLSMIIMFSRVFRIGRLFRVVRSVSSLRMLFNTLVFSLPAMANVLGLLLLIFYVVAVLAVQLFANVRYQFYVGESANFRTFPDALRTVFQISAGDNWHAIMRELMIKDPQCTRYSDYVDRTSDYAWLQSLSYVNDESLQDDCGSVLSPIYFVIFYILVVFIFMNLFIAVVLENFEHTYRTEKSLIEPQQKHLFNDIWKKFDPLALGFIRRGELVFLLEEYHKASTKRMEKHQDASSDARLAIDPWNDIFEYDRFETLLFALMASHGKEKVKRMKRQQRLHEKAYPLMPSMFPETRVIGETYITEPADRPRLYQAWEDRRSKWMIQVEMLAPAAERQNFVWNSAISSSEKKQTTSLEVGGGGGKKAKFVGANGASQRASDTSRAVRKREKAKKRGTSLFIVEEEEHSATMMVSYQDCLRALIIRALSLQCLLPNERPWFADMRLDHPYLWGPKSDRVQMVHLPPLEEEGRAKLGGHKSTDSGEKSRQETPEPPSIEKQHSKESMNTDPVVKEALEIEDRERAIASFRRQEDVKLVDSYLTTMELGRISTCGERSPEVSAAEAGAPRSPSTSHSKRSLPNLGRSPRHDSALDSREDKRETPAPARRHDVTPSPRVKPVLTPVPESDVMQEKKEDMASAFNVGTNGVGAVQSDPREEALTPVSRMLRSFEVDENDINASAEDLKEEKGEEEVKEREKGKREDDEIVVRLSDGSNLVMGLLAVQEEGNTLVLCDDEGRRGHRLLDMSHLPGRVGDAQLASLSGALHTVTHLNLDGCTGATDAGVSSLLARLPKLESASFVGLTKLSNSVLEGFTSCPNKGAIRRLSFRRCENIGNDLVYGLIKHLPSLNSLQLGACHKVGDGWATALAQDAAVGNHPAVPFALDELELAQNTKVSDDLLEAVAKILPNLRRLDVSFCWRIGEKAMRAVLVQLGLAEVHVQGCVKLLHRAKVELESDFAFTKFFFEGSSTVPDSGMVLAKQGTGTPMSHSERIARGRRDLSFAMSPSPTSTRRPPLARSRTNAQLKPRELLPAQSPSPSASPGTRMPPLLRANTLNDLRGAKPEKRLKFSLEGNFAMSERELVAALRSMEGIEELVLTRGSNVSDSVLDTVSEKYLFHSLVHLDLSWCNGITRAGLLSCITRASRMPALPQRGGGGGAVSKLRSLELESVNAVDAVVVAEFQEHLPKLESLNLAACSGISDEVLAKLSALPSLRAINLSWCQKVTAEGLCEYLMAAGKQLTSITLYACSAVNDKVVATITQFCPALTHLNIGWCHGLSESVVVQVIEARGGSLSYLNLYDTSASDTTLRAVAEHCSAITTLDVGRCKAVTSEGMAAIAMKCRTLTAIEARGVDKVNEEVVWALAKGCPLLRSVQVGEQVLSTMSDTLRSQLGKAYPSLKVA